MVSKADPQLGAVVYVIKNSCFTLVG